MECVVQRTECHDHESCDYAGLEKGKNESQEFVQPSQHHQFEHAFQQFSEGSQNEEYHHENQGKGHYLQNLL